MGKRKKRKGLEDCRKKKGRKEDEGTNVKEERQRERERTEKGQREKTGTEAPLALRLREPSIQRQGGEQRVVFFSFLLSEWR